MVEDGRSAEEIADFMVARYGDFVLYRPPLHERTILLWAGPFLLAAIGLAMLGVQLRRRRRTTAAPLGESERERLQHILDNATAPSEPIASPDKDQGRFRTDM